ncbi:short-chain dehydrogenase/reductase [Smaragdicoccus niigatensis]|uniref:short-chain dehydrogenase/reductase n=1 Tax=Smaragdicoccus niigatensis TaxID=359359 RepID=UPI00035FA2CF|nr:short-chain dehydrogenase/reductase [Smaragdicoccus niigatensis]
MKLAGKTVFITGASRGIGAGVARECVAQGANVFLVGTSGDLLVQLSAELGDQAEYAEADVTDLAAVESAVAAAVDRFGGIDVVVANAGIAGYGTLAVIGKTTFDRTIAVNIGGVWNTLNATLPHLSATKGHVLVVCSVLSFMPFAGAHAYAASKAGVEMMATTIALEVAHLGITVGRAYPSWIDTDMVRDLQTDMASFAAAKKRSPWPMNSTMSVEECARRMVRGIRRRSTQVCIPGTIRPVLWGRPVVQSRLGLFINRLLLGKFVQAMDNEVSQLGRSTSERAERQLKAAEDRK